MLKADTTILPPPLVSCGVCPTAMPTLVPLIYKYDFGSLALNTRLVQPIRKCHLGKRNVLDELELRLQNLYTNP
jgi:hypothetical protein